MRCEHFTFLRYKIQENKAKLYFNDDIEIYFDMFDESVIESNIVMKQNGKILAATYIRDFTYFDYIISLIHRGLKLYHNSTVSEVDY